MILLLSVLQAVADHALVLQQTRLLNTTVANLAEQQTQQVLAGAEAAVIASFKHMTRGGHIVSSAPPVPPEGVHAIRVLSDGISHHIYADGYKGYVLEDMINVDGVSIRADVVFDMDWFDRQYSRLATETHLTAALLDDTSGLILQAGSYPILTADNQLVRNCLCAVVHFRARHLTVIVGLPRTIAMHPWELATGRLALSSSLVISLLLALSLRLERIETRESQRLSHLSDSIARLSHQLDRPSLFSQLEADAVAFVDKHTVCAVIPQGAGRSGDRLPLMTRDGGIQHVLLVNPGKRRSLNKIARAGLEQLVYSASHSLDVIQLLEERRAEVENVTALHKIADQARFQVEAVFSAMPDAVMAVDHIWRPTYANQRAKALLSFSGAGTTGMDLWTLLPQPVLAQVEAALRHAADARLEISCLVRWPASTDEPDPGIEEWYALRGVGHVSGMTLFFQRATQQIENENRTRQAAKMEAIGLLTGGIAHDFNNLLTVIMGNLELLELDSSPAADDAGSISDALRAARTAAELTHQLLAFARKQPLAPRLIDVSVLLREMNGLLRSSAGPLVVIAVTIDCPSCLARIDPTQLQNALINLTVNARDAMPEGGALAIHVTKTTLAAGDPLLADGLQVGNYVRIEVTDNGKGVAAENLERVFEPFFTTKPLGAGTGLGLSMVYGFVKQSRGHAAISSEAGSGTTVTLHLPQCDPVTAENPDIGVHDLGPPPGNGETILLVEDVELVREQTARMLRRLRYVVIEAADGQEALRAIMCGASPDLLLTDMELPGGMNGHDLALRVRILLPDLPVLFVTGYANEGLLSGHLIVQGDNLLMKPFTFYNLGSHVLSAVREKETLT